MRFHLRFGRDSNMQSAKLILEYIGQAPNHEFWPDDFDCRNLPTRGVIGHKQMTDAYLIALAASKQGRLATMDEALVALHPIAELI